MQPPMRERVSFWLRMARIGAVRTRKTTMNQYWFPRNSTFEKAYPTIRKIRIEFSQTGDGVSEQCYPLVITNSPPELIRCDYPRCRRGGFDLNQMVYMMVSTHETSKSVDLKCSGDEGSPKEQKIGLPCWNRFSVAITIEYEQH